MTKLQLFIVKIVSHMAKNMPRYRIVESVHTVDGCRWRFTNHAFNTFAEAQRKIKAIKDEYEQD